MEIQHHGPNEPRTDGLCSICLTPLNGKNECGKCLIDRQQKNEARYFQQIR